MKIMLTYYFEIVVITSFCNCYFFREENWGFLKDYDPKVRLINLNESLIDLFSLYILLPHFRPHDGTQENHCFQILKYLRVY